MEYLTAAETGKIWGMSSRRVRILCNEGRVNGAIVKGSIWLIPEGSSKPNQNTRGRKKNISY